MYNRIFIIFQRDQILDRCANLFFRFNIFSSIVNGTHQVRLKNNFTNFDLVLCSRKSHPLQWLISCENDVSPRILTVFLRNFKELWEEMSSHCLLPGTFEYDRRISKVHYLVHRSMEKHNVVIFLTKSNLICRFIFIYWQFENGLIRFRIWSNG